MLEFRGQNEEQYSEGDNDDDRHASKLTERKEPRACRNNHFKAKKREVSQRKPEQKPTAAVSVGGGAKRKSSIQISKEAPTESLENTQIPYERWSCIN